MHAFKFEISAYFLATIANQILRKFHLCRSALKIFDQYLKF